MELNSRWMLGVLFLTIALAVCAPARSQSLSYNPVADESAVVVCGNARFTVLTSRLVRMEWADDAAFEDRATLAVVNRHLEVPAFRVSRTRKGVTIRTKDLTLRYKGPGKFAEGNLCVEFTLNGKKVKTSKFMAPVIRSLPFSAAKKVFGSLICDKTDTVDTFTFHSKFS